MQPRIRPRIALFLLFTLLVTPLWVAGSSQVIAQDATATALSCEPAPPLSQPEVVGSPTADPVTPAADLAEVKVGYVPVSIFAPVFVALEKGYFAEQGLDVSLEPFPGGADPVVLTASGQLDIAIGGAGPAFWNAIAQGLPIRVIAPGHAEGNPVATPLMISKSVCEAGGITSVADLRGKKVSVNARGATEYWLTQALGTAGLSIADIDLQTLPFPDAIAALASGAVDAAMIGEPLATRAEQEGIAVRLLTDFPVQDVQPTIVFANQGFLNDRPELASGFVTAYLRASRDLSGAGWFDPTNLAIVEQYTQVSVALVAAAVQPVYAVDGEINLEGLAKLQTFFRSQGQLEYDEDLDPASIVDTQFVESAVSTLGPAQSASES